MGVKKQNHQLLKEMTSMYKSMISKRGSMNENVNSQNIPLKESECTLNLNMSQLLKFSILRLVET